MIQASRWTQMNMMQSNEMKYSLRRTIRHITRTKRSSMQQVMMQWTWHDNVKYQGLRGQPQTDPDSFSEADPDSTVPVILHYHVMFIAS